MTDATPTSQFLDLDARVRIAIEWAKAREEACADLLVADLEALLAERDRLAAVVEQAPHYEDCPANLGHRCDCWKSAAPSEALAEVKRDAWGEGAQSVRDRMEEYGDRAMDDPDNPYAATREGRS